MSSARLRLSDMQQIYRLLGEVRELARDPKKWRQHAIAGLMRLTEARVGISALEACTARGNRADLLDRVEVGWKSPQESQVFSDFVDRGLIRQHPGYTYLRRHERCTFTSARRDMIADDAWYSSAMVQQFHQACNCDDMIHSRRALEGWVYGDMIVLHRPWGRTPFDGRARRMVAIFHDELAALWVNGRGSPHVPTGTLPRHLQLLINQLRLGQSEKEAAAALGLSRHTIHTYAKELYRRLKVNSRGEAMAMLTLADDFVPVVSHAYARDM
jgi:hypothetical protein